MDSATKFSQPLCFTSQDLNEVTQKLEENKTEDIPLFMEDFLVDYLPPDKIFQAKAEGKRHSFTLPAFYDFCGILGIPTPFVDKIPNALLNENIQKLLDDNNQKIRIGVRGDTIAYTRKDNYVATNALEFLDVARQEKLLNTHLFREGSIGDNGVLLQFEPMLDRSLQPVVENPDDRYNVGTSFCLGFGSGLLQAFPYSFRHVCTNIALSKSYQSKYRLVEKIKKDDGGGHAAYVRLLENYSGEFFPAWNDEINIRLAKASDAKLTDWQYYNAYRGLNSLLGKEPTLSILQIDESEHTEIMADVKYRKRKNLFDVDHQTTLDRGLYDTFNSITAAAKGYSGTDRIQLQTIGGELI